MPPPRGTPEYICIYLKFLETGTLAYISAAGGIGGSIFIQIFLMGSLKRVFSAGDQPFKVIQGH